MVLKGPQDGIVPLSAKATFLKAMCSHSSVGGTDLTVIPVPERQRHEDGEFKVSLNYIWRPVSKETNEHLY